MIFVWDAGGFVSEPSQTNVSADMRYLYIALLL